MLQYADPIVSLVGARRTEFWCFTSRVTPSQICELFIFTSRKDKTSGLRKSRAWGLASVNNRSESGTRAWPLSEIGSGLPYRANVRLSHATRFGADQRALLTVPACGEMSIREGSSGIRKKAVGLDVRSNGRREGVKCETMKAQSRDLIPLVES